MLPAREMMLRRYAGWSAIVLVMAIDVFATGLLGGGERALGIARTLVLPGLGFLEWHPAIGVGTLLLALAGLAAWLRWGVDWLPPLIMVVSVLVAAFVMPLHHESSTLPAAPHELPGELQDHQEPHHEHSHDHASAARVLGSNADRAVFTADSAIRLPLVQQQATRSSHEFTIVLVLFAMVAKLRLMLDRVPGSAWVQQRLPAHWYYPANDIARAAAVSQLAGADIELVRQRLDDPRLLARARRINRWARWRFSGDVLRRDHAPLRAALALAGRLTPAQTEDFCAEARERIAGVPASEPTWVRPLDAMLAALALDQSGEHGSVDRFLGVFQERFVLHRGCRPAVLHAPTMISFGTAAAWEHAAATALGRYKGWLPDDDWVALRPRCLGAAGGGAKDIETLRLIAAGKIWAALTGDTEALTILQRRTIEGDQLACALDDFSGQLA